MSNVPTPQALKDALNRWKVPTRYRAGWQGRGRPASTGGFGPLIGTVNHHTADKGSNGAVSIRAILRLLVNGRSDLPGPLAHFSPDRNGTVNVLALGRANHAGKFGRNIVDAVRRGAPVPLIAGPDAVDANELFWGIENQNDGRGEDYPDAQIESLVRLNAALADLGGWTARASIQHKEGTRRKTDMSAIDGHASGDFLRTQVTLAMTVGPERYGYPTIKAEPARTTFSDMRPTVYLGRVQTAWKRTSGRGAFMGVRAIQRGLHQAGVLNGYLPGIAGPKTKQAYARWAVEQDGGRIYRVPRKRQVARLIGSGFRLR